MTRALITIITGQDRFYFSEFLLEKSFQAHGLKIDPWYFFPKESEPLLGDLSKAQVDFGWNPEIRMQEICKKMLNDYYKFTCCSAILNHYELAPLVSLES